MARQVNGFVGNFTSLTDLNNKYPPAEHAGCSANFISNGTTVKYWSNGTAWGGGDPVALQSLVSDAGITSATVDGSGRPTSVTKSGTSYAITYPSATSVQITDGASFLRQITLDANGRFASMV